MMPSPMELTIILVIVALLFGTKKIRGIGSDLGSAIKGFKDSISSDKSDDQTADTVAHSEQHSDSDDKKE